jgi:hypothetical protein
MPRLSSGEMASSRSLADLRHIGIGIVTTDKAVFSGIIPFTIPVCRTLHQRMTLSQSKRALIGSAARVANSPNS